MRICVPTKGDGGLDDRVGEPFGRSPTYTVYDTETGEVEVLPNTSEPMEGMRRGRFMRWGMGFLSAALAAAVPAVNAQMYRLRQRC